MVSYSSLNLKSLETFGEKVIPGENRDHEQVHALYKIHPEFFEHVFVKETHWCLDRMEVFSDEEERDYLSLCNGYSPSELLQEPNQPITMLFSDAGNGKTCLLYHLWETCKEMQLKNQLDHIPVYVNAKQVFYEYHHNHSGGILKSIATAATREFSVPTGTNPKEFHEHTKAQILQLLTSQSILLLLDDVDLLSAPQIKELIELLRLSYKQPDQQQQQQPDQPLARTFDDTTIFPRGRVIFALRQSSLFEFTPLSNLESLLKGVTVYQLMPGFTFNFLITSQTCSLLRRWPMIEASGVIDESASRWSAFEAAMRAHRRKLFPDQTHSPILLFLLARRLAKGSVTDGDQGTDREFALFDLLEGLFNDAIRDRYQGDQPLNSSDPSAMQTGQSDSESMQIDSLNSATLAEYPIIAKHELDITHLKRLCSLVGFLVHWFSPRGFVHDTQTKSYQAGIFQHVSSREFVARQLNKILLKPGLANMLGFNVQQEEAPEKSDPMLSDEEKSAASGQGQLSLNAEELFALVDEIFKVLDYFYTVSFDGRVRVRHLAIQEFLAARFLSEPSYFISTITSALDPFVEIHPEGASAPIRLELRTFSWSESFFQTDWWWDGVFQFAGVRRGVVWLAGKLLSNSKYETASRKSATGSQPSSPGRPVAGSSPTLSGSTRERINPDLAVFEYWLRNLQTSGVDIEDLGQIRFQIILRVYSAICNHRPAVDTSADPITEWMGKAFSGLVERSPTVFVHLEVFPNYFLSAFNATICNNIIKRCISIFVKRSTHHAIQLISKFHFSPYLKRHLSSLLELYNKRDPKSRLAVFNILRKIDDNNLEKTNVENMLKILADQDGLVRREVVSTLVELGLLSAQQIRQPLLCNLFPDGDALPVISEAIKQMTVFAESNDELGREPQQMLHSKHFSTITALLEQPDPGTRLLGYLCFGSPNFEHNDDEQNGIPARKAALHVCATFKMASAPTPIFAGEAGSIKTSGDNISDHAEDSTLSKLANSKIRGDYYYTVGLNTLLSNTLGENAVCWVSSVMDLLKFKRYLFLKVSSQAFMAMPNELKSSTVDELLADANYVIHSESFRTILMVNQAEDLLLCVPSLSNYVEKNICNSSMRLVKGTPQFTIPVFVQVLGLQVYAHIAQHYPQQISLALLKNIILQHKSAQVIDQALIILNNVIAHPQRVATTQDFDLLLTVLQFTKDSSLHFVGVQILKALGALPASVIDPTAVPIINLLQHPNAAIRHGCVTLIDTHKTLFGLYIPKICELFSLAEPGACFIRGSAIGALSCLSRRGLATQVVEEISKWLYIPQAYSSVEAAIRVLSLVPPKAVPSKTLEKLAQVFSHKSHRVTVAVIDCLANFGEFLLSHQGLLVQLFQHISNPDSEIRSALENSLQKISVDLKDYPRVVSTEVQRLVQKLAGAEQYYERLGVVHILDFFGVNAMISHHGLVSQLILDPEACVRLEILRRLRQHISSRELYGLLRPSVVQLLEDKTRSGIDAQVHREAFRMLRCDMHSATDTMSYARHALNRYFEDIQVKKQAALLLGFVDQLNEDSTIQALVDMLKTGDAKILTEVANIFSRIGLPIVRIVPKMLGLMKGEHPTIKRKLLRFIQPFKDKVTDDYVVNYMHIITMANDTDSVVRKKAAELLTMVSCSLPSDLPEAVTNNFLNAIIDCLVTLNLDRNSFVRREAAISLSEIGSVHPQFIAQVHRKLLKIDDDPFSNILVWRLLSFRWGILIEKLNKRTNPAQ